MDKQSHKAATTAVEPAAAAPAARNVRFSQQLMLEYSNSHSESARQFLHSDCRTSDAASPAFDPAGLPFDPGG